MSGLLAVASPNEANIEFESPAKLLIDSMHVSCRIQSGRIE